MGDQSGAVVWVVLGVPVLVLLAGAVVRPVLPGQQVLVVRGREVRRVVARGLAARVPWRDHLVRLDLGPASRSVPVRAETRDGRETVVLVEASWRGAAWPIGAAYAPPSTAVEEALADRVRSAVAELVVDDLPRGLADRLGRIAADVGVPGAQAVRVELAEVDIVLRTDAGAHGPR